MRYAVWAAVSTESQAGEDKVSIPTQLERGRAFGSQRGWQETAGPYVVPGESRTRWVNLRDAEAAIPDLGRMLDAASHGDFDVLILYDYTRLRDLLDPVARTLAAYGVQLYSLSQPVEPASPEQYDPSTAETAGILQFVSGFTSRSEVQAFRRRYQLGMPKRIAQKKLPPGYLSFGYRKPPGRELDPDAVPIQDPVKAEIVLKIKDLYLAGYSLTQVAEEINRTGVRPPRSQVWKADHMRRILTNPFYAGYVHFGYKRRKLDPRTGKVTIVRNPPARHITERGVHEPLWDDATMKRLEEELRRRGRAHAGRRSYRLSNLLYCGVCNARVWVYIPRGLAKYLRWRCSKDSQHVLIPDRDLLPRVVGALTQALKHTERIQIPTAEDRRPALLAVLGDLRKRRDRLTEAYLGQAIDLPEYTKRASEIDARLKETQHELETMGNVVGQRAERLAALGDLASLIDQVPDYLLKAPIQEVNAELRAILEKIVVTGTDVELVFR